MHTKLSTERPYSTSPRPAFGNDSRKSDYHRVLPSHVKECAVAARRHACRQPNEAPVLAAPNGPLAELVQNKGSMYSRVSDKPPMSKRTGHNTTVTLSNEQIYYAQSLVIKRHADDMFRSLIHFYCAETRIRQEW